MVIKYYVFHIVFLGKAKKKQLAVFGMAASNLLQDKILIDSRYFQRVWFLKEKKIFVYIKYIIQNFVLEIPRISNF